MNTNKFYLTVLTVSTEVVFDSKEKHITSMYIVMLPAKTYVRKCIVRNLNVDTCMYVAIFVFRHDDHYALDSGEAKAHRKGRE